jgi:hypothetical protein
MSEKFWGNSVLGGILTVGSHASPLKFGQLARPSEE